MARIKTFTNTHTQTHTLNLPYKKITISEHIFFLEIADENAQRNDIFSQFQHQMYFYAVQVTMTGLTMAIRQKRIVRNVEWRRFMPFEGAWSYSFTSSPGSRSFCFTPVAPCNVFILLFDASVGVTVQNSLDLYGALSVWVHSERGLSLSEAL